MVEEQSQQEMATKKKVKWLPLQGNPGVWNKVTKPMGKQIIHSNGVDRGWSYGDIYGFDSESLALIPKPTAAIIFLFPITDSFESFREKEETRLKVLEQNISPNLMYFKQTISNACGMMALLHSITNNEHLIGPGIFKNVLQDTRNMSPEERAEYFESCQELARIHEASAHEGQTETPDINEQLRLHFICFVKVDGHLYELDGRRPFPINHGKCIDLIEASAKIMHQFIERDPNEKEYAAIAFSKSPLP